MWSEEAQDQYLVLTRPPQNLETCFKILKNTNTFEAKNNIIQDIYITYMYIIYMPCLDKKSDHMQSLPAI